MKDGIFIMKRLWIALLTGLLLISCTTEPEPAADETFPETVWSEEPEWLTPPEEPVTNLITKEEDIPEGETWIPVYVIHNQYSDSYVLHFDELVLAPPDSMEIYCYYPCVTINPEMKDNHRDILLIKDGGLRVFDLGTGEITELPFSADDYTTIRFTGDSRTNEATGILCKDENNGYSFYDFRTRTFTLGADTPLSYIASTTYGDTCIEYPDDYVSNVYHFSTGELLHSFEGHVSAQDSGDILLYLVSPGISGSNFTVYNSDFEQISAPDIGYNFAEITSEGTIVLVENTAPTSFTVIRENGSTVCTSKEFTAVLFACDDYIFVSEDGKLNIYNYKSEFVRTLSDWTEGAYSHAMISGKSGEKTFVLDDYNLAWYKNVGTPESPVYEKAESDVFPAGIYYITENLNESLGMDGTGLEFCFDPVTGDSYALAVAYIGGYAKPVLYLYPETETAVNVSFAHPERLTVVYPEYPETGWSVTASPDGTMYDADGRSYYALYWEESGAVPVAWTDGFCVAREDVTEFLENTLADIGLTEREANEFIIYWLPVLQKNEYSLIWFEMTESRQEMNELCITPAPDSLLRIAMHVKAADGFVETAGQEFRSFERTGFTAVEWGGVVHEG